MNGLRICKKEPCISVLMKFSSPCLLHKQDRSLLRPSSSLTESSLISQSQKFRYFSENLHAGIFRATHRSLKVTSEEHMSYADNTPTSQHAVLSSFFLHLTPLWFLQCCSWHTDDPKCCCTSCFYSCHLCLSPFLSSILLPQLPPSDLQLFPPEQKLEVPAAEDQREAPPWRTKNSTDQLPLWQHWEWWRLNSSSYGFNPERASVYGPCVAHWMKAFER